MYGGISLSTEDILRDMYILNLTNNRWSLLNSVGVVIPVRALQAGCAVDGKIYLFGGQHILYESNFYDDFY
jgi:N-acetylneuraminic acid mutarotase